MNFPVLLIPFGDTAFPHQKPHTRAQHIDPKQIGFVGFSAGGTTGLILAGAKPVLSRLEEYCAQRPDDHSVCEARGRIRNDHPELIPSADRRIRSFVLLAPLSVVFPSDELKTITSPVQVYVGEKDAELSPADNAVALVHSMPPGEKIADYSQRWAFYVPCTVLASNETVNASLFNKASMRSHWQIENNLHWTLDVCLNEDASRIRRGNSPEIMSGVRQIALNFLSAEKAFKAGVKRKQKKAALNERDASQMLTSLLAS